MKKKSITLTWSSEIPKVPGKYLVRTDAEFVALTDIRIENSKSEWTTGTGHWYPIVKDVSQEWAGPIL